MTIEERVVEVSRELARELRGDRAARAVTPTASLERDVGMGSLERAELFTRLEAAFGRELDDRFLLLDTPREIAAAVELAPRIDGAIVPAEHETAVAASTLRLDQAFTLVDALRLRADAEPARIHARLHMDDSTHPVTYGELWRGAKQIGAALVARGVRAGEPVALMLPTGLDYLQSFMGVLAAGAVAVPLYPPARLDRLGEYLRRQSRILANAEARVLIAMPEAAPVARALKTDAPALTNPVTAQVLRDEADVGAASAGMLPPIAAEAPALIQYTSGSTGDPKGVLLSHANLLANIRAISAGVDMRPTDVVVSWLPLYHDMGLIGAWLTALVQGLPLGLMSPLAFLARPERWLWAIHQERATLSAAPNFAYELCVRKVRDETIDGLDLSTWRCALNGSEAVSAATLDRFANRFERYGFRRDAFMPVYGLAESSVALCFPALARPPRVDAVARDPFTRDGRAAPATPGDRTALHFVSVGHPLRNHEVRVVDDHGAVVAERTVGRVWFRGPSCMRGYYRNPDATAHAVTADGWIDSGDLAYLSDGELYITGRAKDLIIKGGRNLIPQEIEEIAGGVEGIRKGCVAAFGVPDPATGTERLIVIAETHASSPADRERLERAVVEAVSVEVGVPPDVVRVLSPGTVPKTPSGKIRRSAARDAYIADAMGERRRVPWRVRVGMAVELAAPKLHRAARAAGRALYLGYLAVASTAALVLLVPLGYVLVRVLPPGRPVRVLSRFVSRVLLAVTGCSVSVEGLGRLPSNGPRVLVVNHASYADTPVLLAALPIDFVFVAMTEILGWRFLGTFARRGEHPTVDRWHVQQSLADAAAIEARLRRGESALFFAEGGFSGTKGLRPFRLGAFTAAAAAGAPVIPMALRGTRAALPADARFPHPSRIHLWIGEPLRPSGTDLAAAVDLRDRAAAAIAEQCGEPQFIVA
ncbi:MAG TPA: AMP-binding protein [Gemmatimonadaceae bacterium]|nr:AMP-binding protein [Gemmatimonadaceae bacterium]